VCPGDHALDESQHCAKATLTDPGGNCTSFIQGPNYTYLKSSSKIDPLRLKAMFFAKEYAVKLSRNKHFARLLLNIQDFYEELVVALVED
jgi:hypothetical protein